MEEQSAEAFWRLASMTGQVLIRANVGQINMGNIKPIVETFGELLREAEKLELNTTAAQLRRIYNHLFEERGPFDELERLVYDLHMRAIDDLQARFFLSIKQSRVGLYKDTTTVFGQALLAHFPECEEDLAEASKCLALCRYTACVFHLMRAMEKCLYALGNKHGVTIIDKNGKELTWMIIVANLNAKTATLPEGHRKENWHAAGALLHNVGKAWRNTTMHPKQTYTEQEAEAVFSSVKMFMESIIPLVA